MMRILLCILTRLPLSSYRKRLATNCVSVPALFLLRMLDYSRRQAGLAPLGSIRCLMMPHGNLTMPLIAGENYTESRPASSPKPTVRFREHDDAMTKRQLGDRKTKPFANSISYGR